MDIVEKDERMLEMEARMYSPLEWESSANCKIYDLKEPKYEEALRLIKHHFFREEPMCKASLLLQDQSSVNEYIELVRTWIKDSTSLVALSVTSARVVGVAVTRINSNSEKIDTYNRVQIIEGRSLRKIMGLRNALIKETNVYEKLGHDVYFRIHILCVHPSYQGKGVETALLKACVQVAITLKMPAIGGIFTSGLSQSFALDVGFQLLSEIRYSRWIVNDEVVFDDPGRGNYSVAFMAMLIPMEEDSPEDGSST